MQTKADMQSQIDQALVQCGHCKQVLQKNELNLQQEYYMPNYQPCPDCSTMIDESNNSEYTSTWHTPTKCVRCAKQLESLFCGDLCTDCRQEKVQDISQQHQCGGKLQENKNIEGNPFEFYKAVENAESNICGENEIQAQQQYQAQQNSENEPQAIAAEQRPHLHLDTTKEEEEEEQTATQQTISSNIQQPENMEQDDAIHQQQTLEQNQEESKEDGQEMSEVDYDEGQIDYDEGQIDYDEGQIDSEYINENLYNKEHMIDEKVDENSILERFATSFSSVKVYECFNSQQLFEYLEDCIRNLAQFYDISEGKALFILQKAQFYLEQVSEFVGEYSHILLYGDVQRQEFQNLPNCYVCGAQLDEQNGYALKCEHTACKDCWRQYLEVKIKYGYTQSLLATCMVEGCTQIVDLRTFTATVPDGLYWYQKFLIQIAYTNSKRTGHIISCPKVDCDSYLLSRASKKKLQKIKSQSRNISCPSCQTFFCNLCSEEAHLPVSCEQRKHWYSHARNDEASERLIRSIAKPCPFCGEYIQKIDTCLQIICHCLNEFCYECLEEFKLGVNHHSHFDCNRGPITYSYIDTEFQLDKNKLFDSLENILTGYDNLFQYTFDQKTSIQSQIISYVEDAEQIQNKSLQSMDFLEQTLNLTAESILHLKYTNLLQYFIQDSKTRNFLKLSLEILEKTQQKLSTNMEMINDVFIQQFKEKRFDLEFWCKQIMNSVYTYNNCFNKMLMDSKKQIDEQPQIQINQDLQIRQQQSENFNQFQPKKNLSQSLMCIECYTREATSQYGYCDGCYARQLENDHWHY